jgi:hypothetical protein
MLALAAMLSAALAACASGGKTYPALRDVPAAPTGITSPADRTKLEEDLKRERDGTAAPGETQSPTPAAKPPAVPPKRPADHASGVDPANPSVCGETPLTLAQALPTLRGTLHGDLRRRLPREPEGVTGAVAPMSGPLSLNFETGSAALSDPARDLLRERTLRFVAAGGGLISVDARGGASAPAAVNAVRSLENLSLGLKRASAIADYLVALGVPADVIELLVANDAGVADISAQRVSLPDRAEVTFLTGGA